MTLDNINLNISSYTNIARSASGMIYVPVKPSEVIYTQFEHVRGMPAKENQSGVPVNRVKLLNTLISQLNMMKKNIVFPSEKEIELASNAEVDAMIKDFQGQINSTLTNAPFAYNFAGLMPQAGVSFSISA